jgi:hypothetical protein
MKPSFKTTTLIAAIGMGCFIAFSAVFYSIRTLLPCPYQYDLLQDIAVRSCMDVLLISLIVAGAALLTCRPTKDVTKPFRILTYVLALLLVLALISTPIIGQIRLSFWPPLWLRFVLMIVGCVWLCLLSLQEAAEPTPRAFRIALICGIIVLAFPMVCEIISGISLLCSGHILYLHSSVAYTWVRYIVPTVFLLWYSIALNKASKG